MSDFEQTVPEPPPDLNSVSNAVPDMDTSEAGRLDLPAEPETPQAAPKATLRRLFIGDDGLRAGWSVLVYLVLVTLLAVCVNFAIRRYHLIPKAPAATQNGPAELSWNTMGVGEVLQFMLFALPAFFMSLIEKRPFSRYGLGTKRMLPDFLTGLFWGFAALSLLVGVLYLLHAIAFDGVLLHGTPVLTYAAKWGFVFLFVGLFEEFFFRGYLLYTVSRGVAGIVRAMDAKNRHSHAIGFWVSAGIFSIGFFMLAHTGNTGENWLGILQVGLVGAVFAFSLYRTGSLWWAVGMHTSWDWAQSYFYGTADSGTLSAGRLLASHPLGPKLLSGGMDGPEGSVLGIPVLLMMIVVIYFTLPRRDYFLTPDQSAVDQETPVEPRG